MFRRVILIVAVCTLSALQTDAATVYTVSGETYKGKVTRSGQDVIVETSGGRVVLKATTVIHIEHSDPVKPDPGAVVKPASTQPGTTAQPTATGGGMTLDSGAMVLGNAARPEPIIYLYMRALSAAAPGQGSARLRRQIDLWRAHAHDRLRKVGNRWLAPKDYIRHRKTFVKLLAEAEKLNKLARGRTRRYSRSEPPPPLTAKQKRQKYQAQEYMLQAGRAWADPPMQHFLVGIASMHARKFRNAEAAFKVGIERAPLLAGLHQGLGLACAKQEKYLQALEAFLEALRMKPDSAEALHLVRETMKLVPGRSIKSVVYRRAVKAVAPYTTPPRKKPGSSNRDDDVEWLMPGGKTRSWRVSETTMPTPPYDRLEFRQAVGVPLGKHTLVVDSRVVEGAMDIFVRIDGVFVPAGVGRSSFSRGKGRPQIATVHLTERELTPVKVPTEEQPAKAGPCTVHAVGIFGQMKQKIRSTSGTFTPGGEKKTGSVSCRLVPGEATSPVLSGDGRLVGFLAGKTTVALAGAGADKFISLEEVSHTIKRAVSSRTRSQRGSYTAAKRTFTPEPAKGKTFVVYAILGEVFKSGVR